MLVLVWLFSLVMMMRKRSYAAFTEKITVRSGEAVLLSSDLQEADQDFRWTHPHVMVSSKNKKMICQHKRCELLRNGSLRFSQVLPEDSGNYSLQVFSKTGNRLRNKVFQLTVEAGGSSSSSSSSSSSRSVVVSVLICCFLLLLFFIIFFILMRRRRSQMTKTTTDQPAENVYVAMQGNRGNETKDAEKQEKEEKEEESHYVVCDRVVPMKTPITQQMSVDAEDIYV